MFDCLYNGGVNHLLAIKNLTTRFNTQEGIVHAVENVSLTVAEGETIGIVGESGCGKSVTMLSVMGLIPCPPGQITSGEILFNGHDLLKMSDSELREIRGHHIAMIFQDPMTSLNPVLTIGLQITEALQEHLHMTGRQAASRATELLDVVGIPRPQERLKDYPHQFSGGMRQRVMIAMALACNPKLLIADEPTTALDVTIQAQIIDLIVNLQAQLGMAVIWITHDLGVIARLAQRVIVMYAGRIVEEAPVLDLYQASCHPYTLGLLGSLPRLDEKYGQTLFSIPGQPPTLLAAALGCPFYPRCNYAIEQCQKEEQALQEISSAHWVACTQWRNVGRTSK
jgi:oligopeptide transport system ATP-binding protein